MRVVWQDEPIMEEKTRVTLLPIGIEDFMTRWDVAKTLNHKAVIAVAEEPAGLFGDSMVQHVSHRYQSISFLSFHHDPKHSGTDKQSSLTKFLQAKSLKTFFDCHNVEVILLHIKFLMLYLFQEAGAFELL